MALSYLDFDGRSDGNSVQTYTGLSIGTASADRWVIVGVFTSRNVATGETVTTPAGSLTALGTIAVEGARTLRLFKINVTSGTTMNVTITATSGGGAAFYETAVAIWVEDAGEPTLSDQDQALWVSGTMSASVDVPEGGAVLGFLTSGFNGGTVTWAGATQDFRDTTVANLGGAHAEGLSAQSGRTVSASVSGDSFENILKVISYSLPASGATLERAFDAASASVLTLARTKRLARAYNAASTSAFTLTRQRIVNRSIGIVSSSTLGLAGGKVTPRQFASTSTSVLALEAAIIRGRAFQSASVSALTLGRTKVLRRSLGIVAVSTASFVGAKPGVTPRAFDAQSVSALELTRTVQKAKALAVQAESALGLAASVRRVRSLGVASTSALSLTRGKVLNRALGIVSTSSLTLTETVEVSGRERELTVSAESSLQLTRRVIRGRSLGIIGSGGMALSYELALGSKGRSALPQDSANKLRGYNGRNEVRLVGPAHNSVVRR